MAIISKAISPLSLGFDALNVGGGVAEYQGARKEGDSAGIATAKAVGSFAFYEWAGAYGVGIAAVQVGSGLIKASGEHTTKQMAGAYNNAGKLGSGYFEMSKPGYTMRQRSMNAIRSNGLNTQSALGNEARTYFRSSY